MQLAIFTLPATIEKDNMSFLTKASYSFLSLVRLTRPSLVRLPISQSRHASTFSLNPLNWFKRNPKVQASQETTTVTTQQQQPEVDSYDNEEDILMSIDDHTNKFIPITRGTLLKTLVMEKGMFTATERHLMEDFAAALDSHYSQKFYGVMEESKVLLCFSNNVHIFCAVGHSICINTLLTLSIWIRV